VIWEIGIKVAIGKLVLSLPFRQWIDMVLVNLDRIETPIQVAFIERMIALPFHHRDPFDRLARGQLRVWRTPCRRGD
jgi:PIN domain nuclease of toxin-antitoxin system